MEPYINGLFALGGVFIGGLFTLLAAKIGHDWTRVRRDMPRLAEQVASFHALEQEYAFRLYEAEPELGAPGHIKTIMRDRVQQTDGFERPRMTAAEAREIASRYT